MLKSLPNSFEASFIGFRRYIHHVPREKNVLVVCMGGVDATVVAYTLRSRGFENVSVLLTGVLGWRLQRPELYVRYAGVNVTKLEPRRRRRDT
jgi:rhodanese-related sulfurtransferase